MGSETDLVKLYSGRILQLAGDVPLTTRLAAPQATVRKRSPLCGSTVTVDVVVENGKISAFGQDVKACALGQAAAAVLGQSVIGRTQQEVEQGYVQLRAMLKAGGPAPQPPFDGLEALRPAADFKNRHASILLAFEATVAALEEVSQKA